MSLTPHQLATRRSYLTASDVPAVLGRDPYRGPADVLASKTLPMEHSDDAPSEAAERGLRIEPYLIGWAAQRLGLVGVVRNQWRVAENGLMGATLDAVAERNGQCAIEAKTAGIASPYGAGDEWGEDGTDQVPVRHLLQIVGQFIAAPKVERVYMPALLGGRGEALFVVERNAPAVVELILEVEIRAVAWWTAHVVERKPLEDAPPPTLETLRRVRREPGRVVDLRGDEVACEAVYMWQKAERDKRGAERIAEEKKARVLALLGDAEAARVLVFNEDTGADEEKLLKFMKEPRQGYSVPASEPRVARLVKAQKGGL